VRALLIGSAAGGGFPQWNCSCRACVAVRTGNGGFVARTHASLAFSATGQRWYVINATPDIRWQIERTTALHPGPQARHTPLAGILLTDAQLDHTLGLASLREAAELTLIAPDPVLGILAEELPLTAVLERYLRLSPVAIDLAEPIELEGGAISVSAVCAGRQAPRYARRRADAPWSVGYVVRDVASSFAYVPVIAEWSAELEAALAEVDCVLLDGTFWSAGEMGSSVGGSRSAVQMGHLPISGAGGTLERLEGLPGPRKVYVHLNNTNPLLDEGSPERRILREFGAEVGYDGMELFGV